MEYRAWRGYCLCPLEEVPLPEDALPVDSPFSPLVFPVKRDPLKNRAWFAVSSMEEVSAPEDCSLLLPRKEDALPTFVSTHGATVLNVAFSRAYDFLSAPKKRQGLKLTLVGLGDVGGTLLTALKLLGKEIAEIGIYDPNEALCKRYEMELNQVLSAEGSPLPKITICPKEQLFDCDVFLFAASRGVPPVGSAVKDVRMAQFSLNREMLRSYARQARNANFMGLFCQISDPVDQLCRSVFLESNRDEAGHFDAGGLLPEQIQGFGLGVMAARAAYYAEKEGLDLARLRVYGPHGAELVVANDPLNYDETISHSLTRKTVSANLQVRQLGYKPYIAPALSSAVASILRLLRGESHYGAVPMGGAYFGCQSRMSSAGLCLCREELHPALLKKLQKVHRLLEEFSYD